MKFIHIHRSGKKRILLIVFAVIFIAVAALLVLRLSSPSLLQKSYDRQWESGEYQGALDVGIKLMERYPASEAARWTAYNIMHQFIEGGVAKAVIGPGFMMSSNKLARGFSLDPGSKEALYRIIREVADAQRNIQWTYNMYKRIAETSMEQEQFTQAEEFFLLAREGFTNLGSKFNIEDIDKQLIELYRLLGRGDESRQLIDQLLGRLSESDWLYPEILAWKGICMVEDGDYTEAAAILERSKQLLLEHIEQQESESRDGMRTDPEMQPAYLAAESGLEFLQAAERLDGTGMQPSSLTVVLTSSGKPVEGIRGSIRKAGDAHNGYSTTGITSGVFIMNSVESNHKGEMYFPAVISDTEYELLLYCDSDILSWLGSVDMPTGIMIEPGENTLILNLPEKVRILSPVGNIGLEYGQPVEISWASIPDADYYGVSTVYYTGNYENSGNIDDAFRSSVGFTLGRTEDTHISFGVSETGSQFSGKGQVYGGESIMPVSVLGLYHPGAVFSIQVSAYDSDGKLISDSDGIAYDSDGNYPIWRIAYPQDNDELPKGDRLLLDGKYTQAAAAYEEAAESGDGGAAEKLTLLKHAMSFLND